MLQFVSNQVGDFPDLFEDQMASGGTGTTSRPALQTPQTPKTPTPVVYQSSNVSLTASQTLSPQSLPLTPPLTPAQTPSPTTTTSGQQQVTRSPPLLQPRPPVVQSIQPQPQQTAQPTIQVSTDSCTQTLCLRWVVPRSIWKQSLKLAVVHVLDCFVHPKRLCNWWSDWRVLSFRVLGFFQSACLFSSYFSLCCGVIFC